MTEHLAYREIVERIRALPVPPRHRGRVVLVVVRPDVDTRLTPLRCHLSPAEGLANDRWSRPERRVLEAQVSVMRADIAAVVANGQPLSLFGDNLLVELDLSPENLPAGTLVRVGTARCVVTPKPHTGCAKFAARFGEAAREATAAPELDGQRVRGIYVRVLEAGHVSPGDAIEVLTRPPD